MVYADQHRGSLLGKLLLRRRKRAWAQEHHRDVVSDDDRDGNLNSFLFSRSLSSCSSPASSHTPDELQGGNKSPSQPQSVIHRSDPASLLKWKSRSFHDPLPNDVELLQERVRSCRLLRCQSRNAEIQRRFELEGVALDRVARTRNLWDESLCEELGLLHTERKAYQSAKTTMSKGGTNSKPIVAPPLTFLFDSDDLLETLLRIETTNVSPMYIHAAPHGCACPVRLAPPSLKHLRISLGRLHSGYFHVGVGNVRQVIDLASGQGVNAAADDVESTFVRYEAAASLADMQRLASCGVFPALRAKYWTKLMGVQNSPSFRTAYFQQLLRSRSAHGSLLLDDLLATDVDHCTNNDAYFLFQDMLCDIMGAFGRDPWTASHKVAGPFLESLTKRMNDLTFDARVAATHPAMGPSSVQPFKGLVLYAAPLCYVCANPEDAYFLFRRMYALYWCKLSAIDDDPSTALGLCCAFEHLLLELAPQVAKHFDDIGVIPLKIAFPWIHLAFSAYLKVDQLLLLWDRIIAFNTLDLLPLLAASIFAARAHELVHAKDEAAARKILASPPENVATLLQATLFGGEG